jgi:hypothetical protein
MTPHILVQVDSESSVSRVDKKHFRDLNVDGMEKNYWHVTEKYEVLF